MLDRIHMAVVGFDHLDRRAHLLRQEIHIHPFGQPERGVGMPEAINTAALSARAGKQLRIGQKRNQQVIVEGFGRVAGPIGEDLIIQLRGLADLPNSLKIFPDTFGGDQARNFFLPRTLRMTNFCPSRWVLYSIHAIADCGLLTDACPCCT